MPLASPWKVKIIENKIINILIYLRYFVYCSFIQVVILSVQKNSLKPGLKD